MSNEAKTPTVHKLKNPQSKTEKPNITPEEASAVLKADQAKREQACQKEVEEILKNLEAIGSKHKCAVFPQPMVINQDAGAMTIATQFVVRAL